MLTSTTKIDFDAEDIPPTYSRSNSEMQQNKVYCMRHHVSFNGSCPLCLQEMTVNLLEIVTNQKMTNFSQAAPTSRRTYASHSNTQSDSGNKTA